MADFCAAHYGAPEREIMRAAIDLFIQERLAAEPEVRKRYEEARKRRLGLAEPRVVPMNSGK